jgi:hypothetical protein
VKDDEENAFELDGLVVKPKIGKTSPKAAHKAAARPRRELFAPVMEWHDDRLLKVTRLATVILFHYLMRRSVRESNRPFELPVDYIAERTGMSRHQQLRAVRNLVRVGLVKIERKAPHGLPTVSVSRMLISAGKTTGRR